MTIDKKKKVTTGLKKTRSLLDRIIQMVEEDAYCIDIMQQTLAAAGMLRSTHEEVMRNHLETCFVEGVKKSGKKKQTELIEEMLRVTNLHNR